MQSACGRLPRACSGWAAGGPAAAQQQLLLLPPAAAAAAAARLLLAAQRSAGVASTSGRDPQQPPAKQPYGKQRVRLDEHVLQQHPQFSRNLVQSMIAQGKVTVNDAIVTKAGSPVPRGAAVKLLAEPPKYVCRAGFKLEAALDQFGIDVSGLTALDAGLSTGGFTDCLLQRGIKHVYGVDVGYGQVMGSIAQHAAVTVMERTNLRHLAPDSLPEQVSLVTLDLSFISVLKVMPAVCRLLAPGGQMVVLIKPQFEAGRSQVGSGGVVRDPQVHRQVIERVTAGIQAYGLACRGVIESPLKGDKGGNTEFLAHFCHDPTAGPLTVPPDGVRDEGGDGGGGAAAGGAGVVQTPK